MEEKSLTIKINREEGGKALMIAHRGGRSVGHDGFNLIVNKKQLSDLRREGISAQVINTEN